MAITSLEELDFGRSSKVPVVYGLAAPTQPHVAAFKRIFGFFVSVVLFSSPAFADESAVADETYRLVYRFEAGEFLHYEMEDQALVVTHNAALSDADGLPLESRSSQQTQLLKSYRVVTVDESGGAILEPIIEKIRMSSKSGENRTATFDSTVDETPAKEFQKVAGTIGRALSRFQVAANGKLLKVKMLVDDVPKSFSDAAEKADPTINLLVVFPEKDIKIGDKWSEKFDTPVSVGGGFKRPVQLIRNYELLKVSENIATIGFRIHVLTPINDPEILSQLIQQTPTGTIEFDIEHGRMLSRKVSINNKVVEAFGRQTLLQARGESVEQLVIAK